MNQKIKDEIFKVALGIANGKFTVKYCGFSEIEFSEVKPVSPIRPACNVPGYLTFAEQMSRRASREPAKRVSELLSAGRIGDTARQVDERIYFKLRRMIMGNMSYCRFQNTLSDLRDCYENMDNDSLSDDEKRARRSLIDLVCDFAIDYGNEINRDIEEN